MVRKILLLFSLTLALHAFGQNKFIRQIDAGKYSKVWKKADKVLKKDPLNIEFNYYKAIIASTPKSGRLFDVNYAFITLSNVANEFAKVSDYQIILKLNKVPINLEQLDGQLQTIIEVKLELLKKARDIQACDDFLAFYRNDRFPFPSKSLEQARIDIIQYRDTLAFEKAMSANTIEALELFIKSYPKARQVELAIRQIHVLAFKAAQKSKSVEAYEIFIQSYPASIQRQLAQDSIYHIAFRNAKRVNTYLSWNQYVQNYPASPFLAKAITQRDFFQFKFMTSPKTWESYKLFIENFTTNQFIDFAKDSLLHLVNASSDFRLLEYYLNSIDNGNLTLRERHYTTYTADGETSTLMRYYSAYPNFVIDSLFQEDHYWSTFADGLNFHQTFKRQDEPAYLRYILNNLAKDRSLVAVQRILYEDLSARRFQNAARWVHKNIHASNPKIAKFLEIIEAPIDASIQPKSIGKIINSNGNEYAPIPSADEKSLYFCATNREDSKGGEDIFLTTTLGSNWQTPHIVNDLSGAKTNEAPLSISSDGTTFIFFRDGKLYFSQKEQLSWSEPNPLPSVFNQGEWQGDAMISADGEAILFTSVLPVNTYNRNTMKDKIYHGDKNYPTDIYVSVRDSSGEWSSPKSLGPRINTGYCERYPFLHPDMKTLYFSSDGHPGLGQMDVFVSTRISDTCWDCWSDPINLGKEINTPNNDAGYKITTSGEQAFFTKGNDKKVETSVLFLLDVSGSMGGQKIEELKKYYEVAANALFGGGNKKVVKANETLSFEARESETLAIVGESGCGKSTFAKVLMGLETATEGHILLEGKNIEGIAIEDRDTKTVSDVQMVFQNPFDTLNPSMTVGSQIVRALELFKIGENAADRQDRMLELLDLVKLPREFADRMPRQLSGGQKQRVGIARAFAGDAKIVVADEPVSALDVSVQAAVTDLLMDIQREQKTTLLFISHDLSIVRYLSDRVLVMYLGHVVEMGTTEQVFQPPYHPYTEALLSAVPIADTSIEKKHIVLEGDIPSAMNPPSGCPFQTRCGWKSEVPGGLCETEVPSIRKLAWGHQIKCHLADDILAKMDAVIKIAAE